MGDWDEMVTRGDAVWLRHHHALSHPTELRVSHNGQFIIFTLSSDMEGCIRELLASAMNNLSQAATCEIIQLTRIYNTS